MVSLTLVVSRGTSKILPRNLMGKWDQLVSDVGLGVHQPPRGCLETKAVAFWDLCPHPRPAEPSVDKM